MTATENAVWAVRPTSTPGGWIIMSNRIPLAGPAVLHLDDDTVIEVDALDPTSLLRARADSTNPLGRAVLEAWLGSDLLDRLNQQRTLTRVRRPQPSDGAVALGQCAAAGLFARLDSPARHGFWCAQQLAELARAATIDPRLATPVAGLAEEAAAAFGDGLRLRSLGQHAAQSLRALALGAAEHPLLAGTAHRSALLRAADALSIDSGSTLGDDDDSSDVAVRSDAEWAAWLDQLTTDHDGVMLDEVMLGGAEGQLPRRTRNAVDWRKVGPLLGAGPDSHIHLERRPKSTLLDVRIVGLAEMTAPAQMYVRVMTPPRDDDHCTVVGIVPLARTGTTASAAIDLLPARILNAESVYVDIVDGATGAAAPPPADEIELLGEARWSRIGRAVLRFALTGAPVHTGCDDCLAEVGDDNDASDSTPIGTVLRDLRHGRITMHFVSAIAAVSRS
jgi:hypothetical protein